MPRDDHYVSYIQALEEVSKRVARTYAKRTEVSDIHEELGDIQDRTKKIREDVKDLRERVGELEKGETGGGVSGGDSSGSGDSYELPIATKTRLGGIKIGDGLKSTADGTVSVDVDVDLSDLASKKDLDDLESRVEVLEGRSDGSEEPTTPPTVSGDENVIEEIRVNGIKQTPVEKVVDISVPTKVSELDNDLKFQTKSEVDSAIASAVTGGGSFTGIVGVKVNGVDQIPDENVVDIKVPTRIGELIDDYGIQTSEDVDNAIDAKLSEAGYQTSSDVESIVDGKLSDFEASGGITQIKLNGEIQNDEDGVVDLEIEIPKSVSELTNDLQFQTADDVDDAISAKISSVYKPGGSLTYPDPSKLVSKYVGYVYDIMNEFTTDSGNFIREDDQTYPAGTHIVVIETDSSGVYKFDILSGFVDLSGYALSSDLADIEAKANEAKSNAKSAMTMATAAQKKADDAYDMAEDAQRDASTALSDSATAKSTASSAKTAATSANATATAANLTAENAQSTADSALLMASSANVTATSASNTANDAKTLAIDAKSTADAATITANSAKTSAIAAQAQAATAESTANDAKDAIDELNTKVVTMDGTASLILDAAVKKIVGDGPYRLEFTGGSDPITLEQIIQKKINEIHQYLSSVINVGAVPYGRELTESWSEIRQKILDHDTSLHIGDWKMIQLTTGEEVVMELAGLHTYERCGNVEIGPHGDFISRDCLKDPKKFNNTDTNNGSALEPNPWRASKLFQDMNNESTGVYSLLPADLKPCIIEKNALLEKRYSVSGNLNSSNGWVWNYMGKLWLPSEVEVFGTVFWSGGDVGWVGGNGHNLQYPIFHGGIKHVIKDAGRNGDRCNWWMVSAIQNSLVDFCAVGYEGSSGYIIATDVNVYVPLCFRIG